MQAKINQVRLKLFKMSQKPFIDSSESSNCKGKQSNGSQMGFRCSSNEHVMKDCTEEEKDNGGYTSNDGKWNDRPQRKTWMEEDGGRIFFFQQRHKEGKRSHH